MAKVRRTEARDAALSLAWHTAAFGRLEKLPTLASVLTRAQGPRPQTPRDQTTMLHLLSDRFGIPLQRVRLHHQDAA